MRTSHDETATPEGIGRPALRPCSACPYRQDVPGAVWHADEYDKLREYDKHTALQPTQLFQCHVADADSENRRLCARWCGCHGEELLALRLGLLDGRISAATYQQAVEYQSPTPLFDSGAEAADHGQADIDRPSTEALRAMDKISRARSDPISDPPPPEPKVTSV
ncbi:DUF6283 family protein [Nocardia testacea]|uniref:DUF6283 family protein n=1 Tax=Nocardia testacea TaxID=248551 RepID=UPI0002DC9457|nr:DUF6283 family protein [Nocardia testacea]